MYTMYPERGTCPRYSNGSTAPTASANTLVAAAVIVRAAAGPIAGTDGTHTAV
jgi:hypothetical protein